VAAGPDQGRRGRSRSGSDHEADALLDIQEGLKAREAAKKAKAKARSKKKNTRK